MSILGRYLFIFLCILSINSSYAWATTYELTVTKSGTGSGVVSSSPLGISCGDVCKQSYNRRTVVSLTAQAASGSSFSGWSGACTGTGKCKVTVNAVKTVQAIFTLDPTPPAIKLGGLSARKIRTCAIIQGGVKCWGRNEKSYGLGNGSTAESTLPVEVIAPNNDVTSLSSGDQHTCAVVKSRVKCWGNNGSMQIGDGTTTTRLSPVFTNVLFADTVDAISAGGNFTCALLGGGVQCWGEKGTPSLPILSGSGATSLSAGGSHACVVVNGGVQCWGSPYQGKLGNGSSGFNRVDIPVQAIPQGSQATMVSAGQGDHTCAVVNGGVQCWGYNLFGQVGDGTKITRLFPVQTIPAGSGVTSVSVGSSHSCVVINGGLQCWGSNKDGKLGDGTTTQRSKPVQIIPTGSDVMAVTAGGDHTCAVVKGELVCWGQNYFGQLGNGTKKGLKIPIGKPIL